MTRFDRHYDPRPAGLPMWVKGLLFVAGLIVFVIVANLIVPGVWNYDICR